MKFIKNIFEFFLESIGFDSIEDYIKTIFGLKYKFLVLLTFLYSFNLSLFIKNNIWDNLYEINFLLMLMVIDFITGIIKSFKNFKQRVTFRSKYIPRKLGSAISYFIILYMGYNLNKITPSLFFWFPYVALNTFYIVETVSILENLFEMGFINKNFMDFIKDKLNIKNLFNKDFSNSNK